jgi:uncharacterized protein (TIGR02996 family)
VTAGPDLLRAFLDDVVAHPLDPSPWLALADWLDEQGDARGELVRLTWSLRHEPGRGFARRQRRVQQLIAEGVTPVVPRRTLPPDFEFAWVPPGSFLMGSPPGDRHRYDDETRRRVDVVRGFWVGVYPVTQGQWRALMGDNPSYHQRATGRARRLVADFSDAQLDRFPVENVSWHKAIQFCNLLARRTGQPVRLPSEAEWEHACRAGTTTAFCFGNDHARLHEYAVFSLTGEPYATCPDVVGRRKPNAWGLFDVHGNVNEWCSDAMGADHRAARGGAYHFVWRVCRSATRISRSPAGASDVGFRLCFPTA